MDIMQEVHEIGILKEDKVNGETEKRTKRSHIRLLFVNCIASIKMHKNLILGVDKVLVP